MAATIRDLAKKCGLSVSAVSKALNGYSDISADTRAAVMRAAEEMDYHPNAHARALKTGRSYNLGVLFSDDSQSGLTHPFFSAVLEYFKKEAENAGYDVTFISHGMGRGRVTYLDHCRYRKVDGVCVACIHFDEDEVLRLIDSDLPLVTIDHAYDGRVCVCSQNREGIRALLQYVHGLGHRRIAYVHGPGSAVTDARMAAFLETAGELGLHLPPEYIRPSEYTNPGLAHDAALALLSLPVPPTCILVCDDYSAAGVLRAARELGLLVPEDLSVAGFDGIDAMQVAYPPLTTVRQDAAAIGREAARALIALIETPEAVTPQTLRIPCHLLTGSTVGKVKDGTIQKRI